MVDTQTITPVKSWSKKIRPIIRLSGYMLLLSLLLGSCSALKKTGIGKNKKPASPDAVVRNASAAMIQSDWMDARAKINYKDAYMSVGGTATIRLKKDSLLWVSVKKLGFEVARAQITQDSVYILDRLNNEYGVYDLEYLRKSYNLPGDFNLLQSVIMGNPYFSQGSTPQLAIKGEDYLLDYQEEDHQLSYYLKGSDYSLQKLTYQSRDKTHNLSIDLQEYDKVKGQKLFSYFRNLELNSQETGAIEMTVKFSQVEFDVPKSLQFSIPRRYKRME